MLGAVPSYNHNPNHLEPIAPFDGYGRAVFEDVVGDGRSSLWMITRPSFEPERGVRLGWECERGPDGKWIIETWVYFLEVVVAEEMIYEKNSDGGDVAPGVKTETTSTRRHIDEDLAMLLATAWKGVLKRTKYLDGHYRGTDGTLYQFHLSPNYYGEIWSPTQGEPLRLVELGQALESFVLATDEENASALEGTCRSLATEIITKSSSY